MKYAFPGKLHGLLGKLLLAYLLITTLSAVTSGQIMSFYEYWLLRGDFKEEGVAAETAARARQMARFFDNSPVPNTEALKLWLALREQEAQNRRREIASDIFTLYERYDASDYLAVVDSSGVILASSRGENLNNAIPQSNENLSAVDSRLLKMALMANASDAPNIVGRDGDLRIVAAAPIYDAAGSLRGALLVRKNLPFDWGGAIVYLAATWIQDFFFLFFIFIYTGLFFSFFVGRSLIKRLERIGAAANAWSLGDFSARAIDNSADEIGQLTKRLNTMAIQLGDFFELRQNLAAVEERNRLARELHDSVKQQVFALSMQIGAANRVLEAAGNANGNSDKFAARLCEAEKLANQVQRELQDLINELRPASEAGEPLDLRLKALAADWSRQHSIMAETKLEKVAGLSPTSEHALFRIAQEALANIARHSGATKATIELAMIAPSKLQLSISDTGTGFEKSGQKKGLVLKTMSERAQSLPHGWFEINSRRGSGTRVAAGCDIE